MIGKTVTYDIEVLDAKARTIQLVKKEIIAEVIDKVTVAQAYEQPYHIQGYNFEKKDTFIPVTKYVVITEDCKIQLIFPGDIKSIHNPK